MISCLRTLTRAVPATVAELANAARKLGVSYNHLMLMLAGDRVGSPRLREATAQFFDIPEAEGVRRLP